MKTILTILSLMAFYPLQAQKVVEKTYLKPHTELIQIDTEQCYLLQIENSASDEVLIEAKLDGEYNGDLLIKAEEHGKTLDISTGFRPNFILPNDKLSAHKVVSISLVIKVPENSSLRIFGRSCNVSTTGLFSAVTVVLSDGRCILSHRAETTDVTTQSGNILVNTEGASIKATSKYGKVYRERIPKGDPLISLSTSTGNIRLQRL